MNYEEIIKQIDERTARLRKTNIVVLLTAFIIFLVGLISIRNFLLAYICLFISIGIVILYFKFLMPKLSQKILNIRYEPLDKDLDSELFKNVVLGSSNISYIDLIQVAYFIGEYSTVIHIGTTLLKDEKIYKNKKLRYYFLSFIAHSYFESSNYKKLKAMCNGFMKLKRQNDKYFRESAPIFDFYSKYLNGEYEYCKNLCIARKKETENSMSKIVSLHQDLLYAMACYQSGDMEVSKQYFEKVISEAPNLMNYSKLATIYINSINNKSKVEYKSTEDEEEYPLLKSLKIESRPGSQLEKILRYTLSTIIVLGFMVYIIAALGLLFAKYL